MGYIGQFDQVILHAVNKLPSSLHFFMLFITTIGSPLPCVIILLIAIWLAFRSKNKQALAAEIVLLLAMPLASIVKDITKRVRPDTPYVQSMLIKSYSFPSGHAYASLIVFGLLAYSAWFTMKSNWKWPLIVCLLLLIILVGLSRVYLGAHFPSDVLGGWLLGGMVLFLTSKFITTNK